MSIRVLLLTALLAAARLAPGQTIWHVDPDCGDDTWTGLSEVCAAPDGPKRTILAAMAEAVSGDEVVLADGAYRPIDEEGGPIDFAGRTLTLRSRSGVAANCIIWTSAYGTPTYVGRTVLVQGGATARLRGLSFRGGAWFENGAIVVEGATLLADNCEFRDCDHISPGYASIGGAVQARRATASFANCSFVSNGCEVPDVQSSGGGAVYATESLLEFTDCEFLNNVACADLAGGLTQGYGGAVIAHGEGATFERCVFSGNRGSGGAGAVGGSAPLVFVDCDFLGNSAGGSGGAISGRDVSADRCRFIGNQSVNRYDHSAVGGAVNCDNGLIVNCLFADNRAIDERWGDGFGGALRCGAGHIAHSTFQNNRTQQEGGAIAGSHDLLVVNCILRQNIPNQLPDPSHGPIPTSYSNIEGGYPGEGNIDADPLFLAADDFRLRHGSPCIDSGDSSAVPAGITLDLAGLPRFRDDPRTPDTGKGPAPIVDMGAYEFQPGCYADCDGDGELTFIDFLCFQNLFAAGDPGGDCDGSETHDFFDFICFQTAYAAGCP